MENMFEVRYGSASNMVGETYALTKSVRFSDLKQAEAFYNKVLRFAENHGLVWIAALWDGGWLIKSDTTNAEIIRI